MLDPEQIRKYVVRPALDALTLWSDGAEDLVMGTAAVESGFQYIRQLGNGPAMGLWQMEGATHDDIWRNYLKGRDGLRSALQNLSSVRWWTHKDPLVPVDAKALMTDLAYAAGMCRIHYRRFPEPIPRRGEWDAMAKLYKYRYNTPLGKGSEEGFLAAVAKCGLMRRQE